MKNEEKFIYQPSFRTKDECLEFYDHLPLEISSNEFGMHDFRLRTADGERIQQHYTLHFVLRGKGTLLLSGKKYELQENYLFVTPPCVKVTTTPSAEDPWKYFWFGFNGNAAQQLVSLADFSLNKPVFLTNNDKRVRKIIDDLIKDTRRKNSPCRLFALSALLEIFAVIITERKKATAAHKPDFSTDEYIKRAVQIIEERYTDPGFKTSDISKALFISHSYLCRIFNQYTYVTPRQYLIQYRMEQARVYLEKTNESVQKICELVGFNDYFHFTKQFKRFHNYTPVQYRRITQTALIRRNHDEKKTSTEEKRKTIKKFLGEKTNFPPNYRVYNNVKHDGGIAARLPNRGRDRTFRTTQTSPERDGSDFLP